MSSETHEAVLGANVCSKKQGQGRLGSQIVFLIVFAGGYGFGLEGRAPRSRFVPLAAGGRWAGWAARGEGSAAPTASPVAHGRTKRISSSVTRLPQEPTVSGTQRRKTPPNCGGILSWRNAMISAGIWPGHCLGALQEGPTAPPHPQQQEPRFTAPCARGCAWGRARGVPGSRSSPSRLLPPSVPVRELAGRSSAAWKAAAPRQGARKRKHRREECSGHPAGLPVSTSGFKTGP